MGLLMAVVARCGADDRALKPPSTDQTTTSRPPSSTVASEGAVVAPEQFTVTSTAFAQDGGIPDRYTCRGAGAPPPLAWTNVPPGTDELAIVVRAADANRTVHWVMTGIDGRTLELIEGQRPLGAVETPNDVTGLATWAPPCPTAPGTHRYDFSVYAFPAPVRVPPDSPGGQAAVLIEGAPRLGVALISGTVTV